MIDWTQAHAHLSALGIQGDETVKLAAFPPKGGKGGGCRYWDIKPNEVCTEVEEYLERRKDYSFGFIQNPGGTHRAQIEWCRALFFEVDDDSIPMEEQLGHWKAVGLPTPSLQVWTGGKSVHHYFLLEEPITGQEFTAAQKQLFRDVEAALGVKPDTALSNPNRILRLAGGVHPKTGERSVVLSSTGERFPLERLVDVDKVEDEPRTVFIPSSVENATVPELLAFLPIDDEKEMDAFTKRQDIYDAKEKPSGLHFSRMTYAEQGQVLASALRFCPERMEEGSNTYQGAQRILAALVHARGVEGALDIAASACWSQEHWDITAAASSVNHSDKTYTGPKLTVWHILNTAEYNGWKRTWTRYSALKVQADASNDPLIKEFKEKSLKQYIKQRGAHFQLSDVFNEQITQLLGGRAEEFPVAHTAMLGPFLATMASVVGKKVTVEANNSWRSPMVFWFGTVAEAGSMKTPVADEFLKPLTSIEMQEKVRYREAYKAYKASEESAEPPELPQKRVLDDVTMEALKTVACRENTNGLVQYRDELSGWIADMDKYRSGGSDRNTWLSLWSGKGIDVLRKSADPLFTEKTAISVFGCIQPEKLKDLMQQDDGEVSSGDGFWTRFLWIRTPYVRPVFKSEVQPPIYAQLRKIIDSLEQLPKLTLRFSPEAASLYSDVFNEIVVETENTYGARAGFLNKVRGYIPRFAGLLHLLDLATWDDVHTPEIPTDIEGETMKRACILARFFISQFDVLAPEMGASDVPATIARIVAFAETRENRQVTQRDLYTKKWAENSADAATILKSIVSDYGMGKLIKGKRGGTVIWCLDA